MAIPKRLILTSTHQVSAIVDAIEIMTDCTMDECRDFLNNSGAFVDMTQVNPIMRRAVALQEVKQYLKHIIPAPSHLHPTIILLSDVQSEVVGDAIELSYDISSDTVTDPLWRPAAERDIPRTPEQEVEVREKMNESIDRLQAAAELRAVWKAVVLENVP